MTNAKFARLFGGPARARESELGQREMDLARSVQAVTEEVVMRLARTLHAETGAENLCLAGGVALNCVANGLLVRSGPFRSIWIQPAAGDAGGALGAALALWHGYYGQPRTPASSPFPSPYLGPRFAGAEIKASLEAAGGVYEGYTDDEELLGRVAALLAQGQVVGWFQGRMEFGPRALGGRSILGDPRNSSMQTVMNRKIKYRESFRPFAPSVPAELAGDYFDLDRESPYMLIVAPLRESLRLPAAADAGKTGLAKLKVQRSTLPAVTHVDFSARIQTVHKEINPRYHRLLTIFREQTGCGVLVNTSFNVRGEPIVCTPEDAYRCFMRTEMDYLVVENFLLAKKDQPAAIKDDSWQSEFELD